MYWILFLYLMVAYFVPEVGGIALICMVDYGRNPCKQQPYSTLNINIANHTNFLV